MHILSVRSFRRFFKKVRGWGIIAVVVLIVIIAAKLINSQSNSGWQDLSDTVPTLAAPTMNSEQVESSLETILSQYKTLLASAQQTNKQKLISNLDKLYQTSIAVYNNAQALDSYSDDQTLDDLAQASKFLSASLFEIKDSLSYSGDYFTQSQLKNSQDDLNSAVQSLQTIHQKQP